MTALIYTALS